MVFLNIRICILQYKDYGQWALPKARNKIKSIHNYAFWKSTLVLYTQLLQTYHFYSLEETLKPLISITPAPQKSHKRSHELLANRELLPRPLSTPKSYKRLDDYCRRTKNPGIGRPRQVLDVAVPVGHPWRQVWGSLRPSTPYNEGRLVATCYVRVDGSSKPWQSASSCFRNRCCIPHVWICRFSFGGELGQILSRVGWRRQERETYTYTQHTITNRAWKLAEWRDWYSVTKNCLSPFFV